MRKFPVKYLIISSAVILLPILAGLILWNALPDQFATHWNFSGEADGWSTKAMAVFFPSLSMLACHWFCFLATRLDPKNRNQTPKALGFIFWICPAMSLFSGAIIYAAALGMEFDISFFMPVVMGLMFAWIGNYLPKCRYNFTIGLKFSWALHSEENWNATHRFGGKVWLISGVAMIAAGFLPGYWGMGAFFVLLALMVVIPAVYSHRYYKKQLADGTVTPPVPTPESKLTAAVTRFTFIFVAVIFIVVAIILFSGDIEMRYGDTAFTAEGSFYSDLTVEYGDITAIEYREGNVDGERTWGWGSFRLLLGSFKNEEFGNYTRYTYYDPESCVVLTTSGKTIVLSGSTAAETREIYEELTARLVG